MIILEKIGVQIPPAPPHKKGSPSGGPFLCLGFVEFEAASGFTNCQEQFVSPSGARRGSARDGAEYNPARFAAQ